MLKGVTSFLQYLREVHIKELPVPSSVKVVYGNESADFDSVVSALAYAYCSFQMHPEDPLIPIVNIPKKELFLRRDIVRALERSKVSEALLFFAEDLKSLKERFGPLTAVLVDHNSVEATMGPYIAAVVGVVDHHKDAGLHPDVKPRVIRTAGSCSSLVIRYWHKYLPVSAFKDIGLLCLGAGLIDTSNFSSKVEDPDKEALNLYEKLFPDLDRELFYKQIKRDKDDLSGFSIENILKKDYKQFEVQDSGAENKILIGISSVVKPLSWFYENFGGESRFRDECVKTQTQRMVDLYIVMTAWMDGGTFKRELVILSSAPELCQDIVENISDTLQLEDKSLTTKTASSPQYYRTFQQLNTSASRKQVAPCVSHAFQNIKL